MTVAQNLYKKINLIPSIRCFSGPTWNGRNLEDKSRTLIPTSIEVLVLIANQKNLPTLATT